MPVLIKPKYFRQVIAWSLLALILIISGLVYWRHNIYYPSTDDAYVQANIVNIAAQVTGPVQKIYVQDHQFVKQGGLLFTIDQAPFLLAVQTAQAEVVQRQAELNNTERSTARTLTLVAKALLPKASGDDAHMQLSVAKALLNAAQQHLAQAQLDLQHTAVIAPADGTVTNFSVRAGTMVNAGVILFAFIEQANWWTDANFKETDLKRIKIGQPAEVTVDIYPGHVYKAIVQGISLGSGAAFSLLPPENATGNWVKVTQRFPVRVNIITNDPRFPLRVGASSTVTIDTR
jgi:membrane fusion protein (multidrug efflux system)